MTWAAHRALVIGLDSGALSLLRIHVVFLFLNSLYRFDAGPTLPPHHNGFCAARRRYAGYLDDACGVEISKRIYFLRLKINVILESNTQINGMCKITKVLFVFCGE